MIKEFDKIITFLNIIKTNSLFKKNELFNIKEWTRKNIMNNTSGFINYLETLTDLESVKNQIINKENMFHIEIREESDKNIIKNLTDLMLLILSEIPGEAYLKWKSELIKGFVDLMLKQIKEDRDSRDIKHRVFKRDRLCYNFILEHLYCLNRNDKEITLANLSYKLTKKEYLKQLNLYFNMLLIIQFCFICSGICFEGNVSLSETSTQTIQQLIKSAYTIRTKQIWNCLYTNLLELIYHFVVLNEMESSEEE